MRTPYLQPSPNVAAAPATETQPLTVTPDTAPITLPPTAAGPTTAEAPTQAPTQAMTQPMPSATSPAAPVTPEPATANATSPGTPPLAQAAAPVPEDSGITVKVRSALAADSTLAAVPIAVSTDHGVVRLEGQAPDAPTRERATVVASSTAGVKSVDNRLTVPATVVSQAPSGL
ncbi:MAG: BON domain-containing protein [Rubrivivax sp.]|nr:MAG: BON domain-containing protein [Rubrivivax sp.]